MTTTEQRLAAALRAVMPFAERDVGELLDLVRDDESETEASEASEALWAARNTLAAYDAQHAMTPSDGMWRVEDYAVSNGESGVCIKEGDDTVLDLPFMPAWPESTQRARAARIVQCVNAHDGLVAALQECADYLAEFMEEGREHRVIAQADELLEGLGVIERHQFEAFDPERNEEPGEWCKHFNLEKVEHGNA